VRDLQLKGIIPPAFTMLKEDESLDAASYRRFLRFLLDRGVHGLFVLGSAGEGPCLTSEVRRQAVEVAVDTARGRAPVLAGVLESGTRRVIDQAEMIAKAGADAIVTLLPYYFKVAGRGEVVAHFRRIADASALPVVLYDLPAMTGRPLQVAEVAEICERCPNVIALKDSTASMAHYQELIVAVGRGRPGTTGARSLALFNGDVSCIGASVLMGGDGAVASVANLAPRECVLLYEAARTGDVERTRDLQRRMSRLRRICGSHPPFVAGKVLLEWMGLGERHCTAPTAPLTPAEEDRLRADAREMGLI